MSGRILSRLREWLPLGEAATELSEGLGETVSDADILRLAVDGHLRLSLYLSTPLKVLCQRIDDEGLDPDETHRTVVGLCDIAMFGRTKRQVERTYQWMKFHNYVPHDKPQGAHVEQGEWFCRLPPDPGASGFSPRAESEFPQGSIICVRRSALEEFIQRHTRESKAGSAASTRQDREAGPDHQELGARERVTLLVMIAALAKEAKIDVSKASKAGGIISKLAADVGLEVAPNTIARHLRNLSKFLPDLKTERSD